MLMNATQRIQKRKNKNLITTNQPTKLKCFINGVEKEKTNERTKEEANSRCANGFFVAIVFGIFSFL